MFNEVPVGRRQVAARPRRTKVDRAEEVAALLRTRDARCEAVTPARDTLGTPARGAFYEVFGPDGAGSRSAAILPHARTRQ